MKTITRLTFYTIQLEEDKLIEEWLSNEPFKIYLYITRNNGYRQYTYQPRPTRWVKITVSKIWSGIWYSLSGDPWGTLFLTAFIMQNSYYPSE